MQIHISRRRLIWWAVIVLAVIALVVLLISARVPATTAAVPTQPPVHTPMSAEGWSQLFLNAPGERTMEDGSTVLTGRATWFRRDGNTDEIHLRTREGINYNLVIPENAFVYRAEQFFSASYPQPTIEDPRGVLARLKDTPVMVRIRDGRVTTVFVLLEVEE